MIGGTSGSETKLFQPSASQSNRTQTRSSSLGSRNTCAPLEPCCLRFSAPFVEKILSKRSKSSTVVVARIILYSSNEGGPRSFRPEPRAEGTPTDPTDGGDDCHRVGSGRVGRPTWVTVAGWHTESGVNRLIAPAYGRKVPLGFRDTA